MVIEIVFLVLYEIAFPIVCYPLIVFIINTSPQLFWLNKNNNAYFQKLKQIGKIVRIIVAWFKAFIVYVAR